MSYKTTLGWGLLSQFPPFRYFPNYSSLSKHTLTVKYRVYIWQVSPQLSCGDTCWIWMWFEESNMYFYMIKILLTEKLTNGALVTPTPGWWLAPQQHILCVYFLCVSFIFILFCFCFCVCRCEWWWDEAFSLMTSDLYPKCIPTDHNQNHCKISSSSDFNSLRPSDAYTRR